jgi:tetratricopeptide (TPR) repeat protein
MGPFALILVLLATPGFAAPDELAEILQLQRSGQYEEAWEKSVALYANGRRDPVVVQTIQSLGLRLGRYDELTTLLELGSGRSLSVREQLLWADILLRQGETDKGLTVVEGVVAGGGPVRLGQVIRLLTSRGMVSDAMRLARRQRGNASPGDATWGTATRELVSLTSREGLVRDCVQEALELVASDASSFAWATGQLARVSGVTREMVMEAVSAVPASPEAHLLAAGLLLRAGDPEAGLALLHEGPGSGPEQLLQYAADCQAGGHYETASKVYQQVLASDASASDTLAALEGLTVIRSRLGMWSEAAEWANRLLAAGSQGERASEAHLVLAQAALAIGRSESAVEHARAALGLALGDQRPKALWIQAEALLIHGEAARAGSVYARIARQWPADTLANDCLARVTVLADSCQGLDEFVRGVGLRWQGRYREAAERFSEAAASCPGMAMSCEGCLEAATSWIEVGELPAAEACLRVGGQDSACAAKSLMLLGRVFLADSRTDDAARIFEQLLLQFPDSPMVVPARRELGWIRAGAVQ